MCYPCPPGTSCTSEGSIIPNLCGPGTFRSAEASSLIPCEACPQGTWSKNYGLTEAGECVKCPPGVICPVEGMTEPCSYSDLPTPYSPIVKYQGNPSEEYLYSTSSKRTYYAQFACLALNSGYSTGTMTAFSQTYFFGELVPPYIDVLGRGANFRATDQFHLEYQTTAKCYVNLQKLGSSVYQRISNYLGPTYDIQAGHGSQGYSKIYPNGTYYYSGFFGQGSLAIDLPYARIYEPSYNCTPGFRIMNESTILYNSAGLTTYVYTDVNNDYPHLVSRQILLGIDQFYPGTCEADTVCYEVSGYKSSTSSTFPTILTQIATQSTACPEGFVCDEATTTNASDNFPCRGGYVCDFGTTPDPSIKAPQGQFTKLCPPGYVCNDGTGLGQLYREICPPNFYCPTGTVDYMTGAMAGDAVNRGLSALEANPYLDRSHVVYTVVDDVRVLSGHDQHCLSGIDTDLSLRYTVSWLAEGAELNNPYLSYLRKHVDGKQVPYSNNPLLTGHNSTDNNSMGEANYDNHNYLSPTITSLALGTTVNSAAPQAYYRPVTIKTTTENDLKCARDHKWRLIDETIYRKECDCSNFFRVVIAVYRFWLCTYSDPLVDLGFAATSPIPPFYGGRDFWFQRYHASSHQCVFLNATNINMTHGAIPFNPNKPSLGSYTDTNQFLNFTLGATFQFTWTLATKFRNFAALHTAVIGEYEKEYADFSSITSPRSSFDPHIFDLKNAIDLIEEYGMRLEELIWLEDGYDYNNRLVRANTPGRSDMCQCERLTKCPNGTISFAGSSSVLDCISKKYEVLRRVSVIPSWYNLSTPGLSGHLANLTDFVELGGGDLTLPKGLDSYPIGSILLEANDVAVVSIDFRELFYNLTYGEDYQIGVYVNCKPCPPRYQCNDFSGAVPTCTIPTLATQKMNYDNCMKRYSLVSCMLPNGLAVPCTNSSIQVNSTFNEPNMFKCNSIPFFCDQQLLQKMIWQPVFDKKTGRAAIGSEQEKSKYVPDQKWLKNSQLVVNPTNADTYYQYIPGCCACERHSLPYYFTDNSIDVGYPDNKHNFLQLSFMAVEAVQLTIVIELLHGQYVAEFDDFVQGKSDIYVHRPSRAHYTPSAPSRASFMALITAATFSSMNMDYPLNLPIQNYRPQGAPINSLTAVQEEGQVLIGRLSDIKQGDPLYTTRFQAHLRDLFIVQLMEKENTTSDVPQGSVPNYDDLKSNLYPILNPYSSVSQAALTGTGVELGYLGLPYFPFFSNCRGSGSFMSISKVLETDPRCAIVNYADTISVSAYPWKNQLIPNADQCNSTTLPADQTHSIGNQFISPWLGPYNGALFDCNYEEQIEVAQNTIRWYEAGATSRLFYLGKYPNGFCPFHLTDMS